MSEPMIQVKGVRKSYHKGGQELVVLDGLVLLFEQAQYPYEPGCESLDQCHIYTWSSGRSKKSDPIANYMKKRNVFCNLADLINGEI